MIPNVLSIAGSDPSGGAGIQADINAISANGAFAYARFEAFMHDGGVIPSLNPVSDIAIDVSAQ